MRLDHGFAFSAPEEGAQHDVEQREIASLKVIQYHRERASPLPTPRADADDLKLESQ